MRSYGFVRQSKRTWTHNTWKAAVRILGCFNVNIDDVVLKVLFHIKSLPSNRCCNETALGTPTNHHHLPSLLLIRYSSYINYVCKTKTRKETLTCKLIPRPRS